MMQQQRKRHQRQKNVRIVSLQLISELINVLIVQLIFNKNLLIQKVGKHNADVNAAINDATKGAENYTLLMGDSYFGQITWNGLAS